MSNDKTLVVSAGHGVQQGFGTQSIERAHETASTAVAAQARAAVEARYIMAQHRPRDMDMVRTKLLKDCRRPSFSRVARYLKPIGKGVAGPSIRFVEAAMRAMTNILPEAATIYDDASKRIVRVSVTDLEANLTFSKDVVIEKTIERSKVSEGQRVLGRRKNSYGKDVYLVAATEDDLLNKQGALESKAIRTQGLRLIPGDLVDEAMALCIETAQQADAQDPDAARKGLADAFTALGVNPVDLSAYLGHDLAKSSPAQLEELRAIYSAVRDGEASWADALDYKRNERGELDEASAKKVSASKGVKGVKERLAVRHASKQKAEKAEAPKEEPKEEPKEAPAEKGDAQ